MSSSARWCSAAAPSVAPTRICSTTLVASASSWDTDCSRADSAVVRMAAARSAISLDGFFGATASLGAVTLTVSTMAWGSSGVGADDASVSVGLASESIVSGGTSASTTGQVPSSDRRSRMSVGSADPTAASGDSGRSSSLGRSELHGSRNPERVSVDAMTGKFLCTRGTENRALA